MHLMMNRTIHGWPRSNLCEYILFVEGLTLRRFTTTPNVASRYCRRYGIIHAAPIDFYRLVVCKDKETTETAN